MKKSSLFLCLAMFLMLTGCQDSTTTETSITDTSQMSQIEERASGEVPSMQEVPILPEIHTSTFTPEVVVVGEPFEIKVIIENLTPDTHQLLSLNFGRANESIEGILSIKKSDPPFLSESLSGIYRLYDFLMDVPPNSLDTEIVFTAELLTAGDHLIELNGCFNEKEVCVYNGFKIFGEAEGSSAQDEDELITISGQVQAMVDGDDGYTAEILTDQGETFFVTISIPNLGESGGYRRFEVGEEVTVFGEAWELKGNKRITVLEIK